MAWIASVTVTGHLTVPGALFGADGRKDALRELTVSVLAATFVCTTMMFALRTPLDRFLFWNHLSFARLDPPSSGLLLDVGAVEVAGENSQSAVDPTAFEATAWVFAAGDGAMAAQILGCPTAARVMVDAEVAATHRLRVGQAVRLWERDAGASQLRTIDCILPTFHAPRSVGRGGLVVVDDEDAQRLGIDTVPGPRLTQQSGAGGTSKTRVLLGTLRDRTVFSPLVVGILGLAFLFWGVACWILSSASWRRFGRAASNLNALGVSRLRLSTWHVARLMSPTTVALILSWFGSRWLLGSITDVHVPAIHAAPEVISLVFIASCVLTLSATLFWRKADHAAV